MSIVATSLDVISPEEKSVVSMVHRIHNRNSGYLNPAINPNVTNNAATLNSTPTLGNNALKIDQEIESENVPVSQDNLEEQDSSLNEISLDSLGYIENTERNSSDDAYQQTDMFQNENSDEEEQTTPQLFSQEENTDSFKQDIDIEQEKQPESLIQEDEEEDFEIPAFLRQQKN